MKRLQLTLRDLFWLVFVMAMGCAWWLSHQRAAHQAASANARIAALEAELKSPLTIRRRQNLAFQQQAADAKQRATENFEDTMKWIKENAPEENQYSLRIKRD